MFPARNHAVLDTILSAGLGQTLFPGEDFKHYSGFEFWCVASAFCHCGSLFLESNLPLAICPVFGVHYSPPTLAHLGWWTTRGKHKTKKREKEQLVLEKIDTLWGKEVLHIWDRGFAGKRWLTFAFMCAARFVMRWPKNYYLLDEHGNARKPGEISKGKRSWEHRMLWDARRRCQRKVGIIAFPVFDPTHRQPLWLVVARRKHQSPWYLLTTQPILCPDDAWNIVHSYARRWQVEMTIRFSKSELAFESPRLSAWQHRKKLLLITSLVYAFLLSLLSPHLENLRNWLLYTFCHRTGKRSRETPAPLYRLRLAISLFWFSHPPPFFSYL